MPQPREIYTPPTGPPQSGRPDPAIFARMGEANIFKMMEDFYGELSRSKVANLFARHPQRLRQQAHKSAAFFVFVLGGPPLYHQLHGNPMMRGRHLPFVIDETARREWLACFHRTLENADTKFNFPMEHMPGFLRFLDDFSAWMVNTKSPDAPEPAEKSRSILGWVGKTWPPKNGRG
jgi:hemoglobin